MNQAARARSSVHRLADDFPASSLVGTKAPCDVGGGEAMTLQERRRERRSRPALTMHQQWLAARNLSKMSQQPRMSDVQRPRHVSSFELGGASHIEHERLGILHLAQESCRIDFPSLNQIGAAGFKHLGRRHELDAVKSNANQGPDGLIWEKTFTATEAGREPVSIVSGGIYEILVDRQNLDGNYAVSWE